MKTGHPPLDIRPATLEDVPLVLSLIREIAEYEKLLHEVVATEESLRAHLFGERPAAEVLLGFSEGQPAGFALFFQNFSTFMGRPGLYLEDLYFKPEFRRRGYGKAMLLHLARLAQERNCGRFEWTVLDWNEPAIRFYEKLGASVLPDWRICRVAGPALRRLATSAE